MKVQLPTVCVKRYKLNKPKLKNYYNLQASKKDARKRKKKLKKKKKKSGKLSSMKSIKEKKV